MIPKTVTKSRLAENKGALDFKLDQADVDKLTALNCNYRAFDPVLFKNFGYFPNFDWCDLSWNKVCY